MSYVTHLECSKTGERGDHRRIATLSSAGAPWLVRYDLDRVREAVGPAAFAPRVESMWRYHELLPADDPAHAVTLGEGKTPMIPAPRHGRRIGLEHLVVMDEGQNPTGSFKDRGASMGITRLKELGVTSVAMATAGNAGGAWAAYGRRAGLEVHVAMPKETPVPNKHETRAYGAHVEEVDGVIADAGKRIAGQVAEHGWFDACTLKEPYRIEGKKTLGLEIAEHYAAYSRGHSREQSGVAADRWGAPDAVIYPTGGGVGIIGIWKAYEEMRALGWLDIDRPPKLISVQAAGCAPIVRAFEAGREDSDYWDDSHTIASGLRVPKALGDFLVLRAVRETGGTAIAVDDDAMLKAMSEVAAADGILCAPEGAATLAAAAALRESGFLAAGDRVLAINTATAYKYPEALAQIAD